MFFINTLKFVINVKHTYEDFKLEWDWNLMSCEVVGHCWQPAVVKDLYEDCVNVTFIDDIRTSQGLKMKM